MHGESNKKWGKGLQGAGEFIRVVNASKVYQTQDGGEVEAFTNFNLEIEEDEFLVLVGPSGCGKSTLLKMIVGLLPPTRWGGLLSGHGSAFAAHRFWHGFSRGNAVALAFGARQCDAADRNSWKNRQGLPRRSG